MKRRVTELLCNEQGYTLIEALISSMIIVVIIITIFIGIVFAEKQLSRNYHDRVATLHASGELEWQYYYRKTFNRFNIAGEKNVTIDLLPRNKVLPGKMGIVLTAGEENVGVASMTFSTLEVKVSWTEPGDKKLRTVVLKEDFY